MTDITQIPLNKLVATEDTVRRTAPTDADPQELAASIAAHGLLQSLVVRKHRKAKYAVVAGGRRLAALQLLAEQGSIDASFAVPCQVQDGDDATELRLVEPPCANRCIPPTSSRPSAISSTTERPSRISPPASASPPAVEQRLRLARVSPLVIGAFRAGELTLVQVMAFAISDDHARAGAGPRTNLPPQQRSGRYSAWAFT